MPYVLSKKISPQCQIVLRHLSDPTFGSITGAEASTVYRIRHLPSRIWDLKDAGVAIKTERKVDPTGQRYVRYSINHAGVHANG